MTAPFPPLDDAHRPRAGHSGTGEDTIESWALDFLRSRSLSVKTTLPPCDLPLGTPALPVAVPRWPGRPAQWVVTERSSRTPSPGALRSPEQRARLLHTFWHHELQAAELMCWALLTFTGAEASFRRGLFGICRDEIRHMSMYQTHIERLGHRIGDFPVRDWFWTRVPSCRTELAFVALMGMGLEAANLEHSRNFADQFRRAGDERGAALQERIGSEEVAHVAFAVHWFERLGGRLDFEAWKTALPPPLSPLLLRGRPLDRERRLQAGLDAAFIDALDRWRPSGS